MAIEPNPVVTTLSFSDVSLPEMYTAYPVRYTKCNQSHLIVVDLPRANSESANYSRRLRSGHFPQTGCTIPSSLAHASCQNVRRGTAGPGILLRVTIVTDLDGHQ